MMITEHDEETENEGSHYWESLLHSSAGNQSSIGGGLGSSGLLAADALVDDAAISKAGHILNLALLMWAGLRSKICDRRYRMLVYKYCFLHGQAVEWMQIHLAATMGEQVDEETAVATLNELLEAGYVTHVCNDHKFQVGEKRMLFFHFHKHLMDRDSKIVDDASFKKGQRTLDLAVTLRAGLGPFIRDRRYGIKQRLFKQCFLHKDAVEWMSQHITNTSMDFQAGKIEHSTYSIREEPEEEEGEIGTDKVEEHAVILLNEIVDAGYLTHVCNDHRFKAGFDDAELFFHFHNDLIVRDEETFSKRSGHDIEQKNQSALSKLWRDYIFKTSWCNIKTKANQTKVIGAIFDKIDQDGNGRLDKDELEGLFLDASKHIKLKVDRKVIQAAVSALMADVTSVEAMESIRSGITRGEYSRTESTMFVLDNHDKGDNTIIGESMNRQQFIDMFKRHPDMLRVFQDEHAVPMQSTSNIMTTKEWNLSRNENEQAWKTNWKNNRMALFWLFLYVAANVTAFSIKAYKYANNDDATAMFGHCIVAARGAAQCLNLNCALVLLSIARHFITTARATKARFFFPFDSIVDIHMLLGKAVLFWVLVHVSAHICDFHRLAQYEDPTMIQQLFGDKMGDEVPNPGWDRWKKALFDTRAGVTGLIMVFCILVAYPMIHFRRKYFNAFWGTHQLLLVMLLALCIHGTQNLLEQHQSVFWLALPLALYTVPRLRRETPLGRTAVIDAEVKTGGTLCLQLEKPSSWKGHCLKPAVQSGMYAFIQVPAISPFEWHPFSLTSAPSDPYIEFHIGNAGDWTSKLHEYVEKLNTTDVEGDYTQRTVTAANDGLPESGPVKPGKSELVAKGRFHDMIVKVDGPIGASSQGFKDYPFLVLVGAGIGVTPMISVLRDLMADPGKMKRVFFYWTVRDRAAFEWFSDLMNSIYRMDEKNALQIRHFLTSVKDDDRDIGAVLLHHATRSQHRISGFDLLLGQQTRHQVEVGRPDWAEQLMSVKREAKSLGYQECGVFLCGPERMGSAVAQAACDCSNADPDFHFPFKKETF